MDPFQGMHAMVHNPHVGVAVSGHGSGSAYMMSLTMADGISTTQIDNDSQLTPVSPSIPLKCCICPKNGTFSDVSHLLTHVSSKGHLAKKFSYELAANESEAARKTLHEFHAWYEKYNIRQLLQNRNQSRNQRVTKGRGRGSSNTSTTTTRRSKAGSAVTDTSSRGKKRGYESGTLAIQPTKFDDDGLHDGDLESVSSLQPPSKKRRSNVWDTGSENLNNISLWNDPYYESGMQQGFVFGDAGDGGEPVLKYENSDGYENEKKNENENENENDNDGDNDEDRSVNSLLFSESLILYPNSGVWKNHSIENLELTKEEDLDRQSFRKYLKGDIALIPGVGGFDSASDDQKRMRNQKKDPSVMHQMELESRLVTTLEEVTDMKFNHMRSGDVYDEPSIDGDADDGGEEDDMELAQKPKRRSPKTRAQAAKARGNANSGDNANLESTSRTSKGTASRGSRRGTSRATRSRSAPDPVPDSVSETIHEHAHEPVLDVAAAPQLGRFDRPNLQSPAPFGLTGFVNSPLDVFRDSPDPIQGRIGSSTPQRRQDTLPGLSLRPGNPNFSLQSPSARFKRQANSHHSFNGKENNHLSFQPSQATSNPYLNTHDSLNVNSVNPLCAPNRGNDFRGFSSYEDAKPLTTGFQPINGHAAYNSLQMARSERSDNKGYQSQHRRNVYDI